jgi:hypothetical protein
MSNRAAGRELCLLALVALSGCYVTAPIKPSELARLDGYRDGEPKGGTVSVLSPANQPVTVAGSSQIYLDLPDGTYGGTFKSIQVSDGVLSSVTEDGQAKQVPLESIKAARVREPSPGTTVLVGVGIAAAVLGGTIWLFTHSNHAVEGSYGVRPR